LNIELKLGGDAEGVHFVKQRQRSLHSVSVEMTGLYVIPSGTKWNRGISILI